MEVTVWANSPLFFNPTNIDIDKDGGIWVAEGVNGWGTVASYTPVPNADVVQVSPLITRIETTVRTGQGAAANRKFRVLTDPFVNAVITHEPTGTFNPDFADLCLFDTTPVTIGAVYSYYLVHFDSRFAIDYMINAGTVAITPR